MQTGLGGAGLKYSVTDILQHLRQAAAKGDIVVDNQDACHGNSISKRAPCDVAASIIFPPCACTISRTKVSPNPVPPGRAVVKGSKMLSRNSAGMPAPCAKFDHTAWSGMGQRVEQQVVERPRHLLRIESNC